MTTTIKKTELGSNEAVENTEGVPIDGFQDPTGEYPKKEYYYGSSINRSARGLKVEDLYLGGGVEGTSLDLEDQEPSRFPFNQVKETPSGHIISYDDTPGGERILIKHRKGAGVEVRADGSVVISALKNKVEVTGGDQTIIIEGNGKMHYQGDLNLDVSGDYNVNVGGDYNLNIQGNSFNNIRKNIETVVGSNTKYETKGTATNKTLEHKVDVVLGNQDNVVKGYNKVNVGAQMELFTANYFQVSAEEALTMSALNANIQATELSIVAMKGLIGGEAVEFTGPVYMGPLGDVPFYSGAAFYGSFHGQSTEAIRSYSANHAQFADYASDAGTANTATVASSTSPGQPSPTVKDQINDWLQAIEEQETPAPVKPVPRSDAVASLLMTGFHSIKPIVIDEEDEMRNTLLLRDDYGGLYEKHPTINEIRSTMRDETNRGHINQYDVKVIDQLVADGKLAADWKSTQPPQIGRVAKGGERSPRYGYNALGNSVNNRGKRIR